ncbi:aspartate ammonia-lyase [Candidatus Bathyarchaeota archaeon]|nr:aspartate ammonia-lyase [Candidatus Bathyarchaeota archaeon]
MPSYRTEEDALGKKKIPRGSYFGIFTQRALENFSISNVRIHPKFIKMLATVKKAANETNLKLDFIEESHALAIKKAADEVIEGKLSDQFPLDVFQAGAGTPWNMNMNEVLANRANEILGEPLGEYSPVHPNNHVNMMQSSNDVIPNTIRLTSIELVFELLSKLDALERTFSKKSMEFRSIRKSGRTHLRDAVPITLGQEMGAYASTVSRAIRRIKESNEHIHRIFLGGTAVGTGLNTHPDFSSLIIERLVEFTGFDLSLAEDFIEKTQFMSDFQDLIDAVASLSLDLVKINNDLMILSSGPKTGLKEIKLPPVEPGSSIMPGKVNPSILESVNMVCFQILGSRTTIEHAVRSGAMDLNVYTPVIAFNLLNSLERLKEAVRILNDLCIKDIEVNEKVTEHYFNHSNAISTLLSPIIGYEKAAKLSEEAMDSDVPVSELAISKGLVTEDEMDMILENATEPNLVIIEEIMRKRENDQET